MMRLRKSNQREEQSVVDMMEGSLHLLKMLPLQVWLLYLVGTVPFLTCFVVYWAEMANSGLAYVYLAPGALVVCVAYLWMKLLQAFWLNGVRNTLIMEKRRFSWSQRLHILRRQMIFQPLSLVAIPVSLLMMIPFPWVLAYFQGLTVCESLDEEAELTVSEKASRYASRDKMQLGMFALLWLQLLIVFVFLSWLSVLGFLPFIFFSLTGIENEFVSNPYALFANSALYITALVFTYLTLDPLVKAFFFLRCYYADAEQSGMDILVTLKRLSTTTGKAAVFIIMGLLALGPTNTQAETADPMSQQDLERAIEEVSSAQKYIWQHPPEAVMDEGSAPGWAQSIQLFIDDISDRLNRLWRDFRNWMRDVFKKENPEETLSDGEMLEGTIDIFKVIMVILVVILAGLVVVILLRGLRKQMPTLEAEGAAAVEATDSPDLTREDVRADALSIDRWLEYARELAAKGEYRLALRAIFLAQIAYLAEQRVIVLARFKSNRDYARELGRRAHAYPIYQDTFRTSSRIFESIWYGNYPVDQSNIDEMTELFRRLAPPSDENPAQ